MLASTFAAYAVALLVAHQVADHWIQTHHQAVTKGHRSRAGALACLGHVATYTATAGACAWWLLDLALTPAGFITGQLVSAVTPLLGRPPIHPRTGRMPTRQIRHLAGGAYQLDQAWHWLWLGVAAILGATL